MEEKLYKLTIGLSIFYIMLNIIVLFSGIMLILEELIKLILPLTFVTVFNIWFMYKRNKLLVNTKVLKRDMQFKEIISVCTLIGFFIRTALFLVYIQSTKKLISEFYNFENNIFFKILLSEKIVVIASVLLGVLSAVVEYKDLIKLKNEP